MEGARFPLEVQERISNMHLYGTDYYDKKDEIDQRRNEIEELKSIEGNLLETLSKVKTELSRRKIVSPVEYPDDKSLRGTQYKQIITEMGEMDNFKKQNKRDKMLTRQEDMLRIEEDKMKQIEVMDINNCNNLRDICLADPADCFTLGYHERLKQCRYRTAVFVKTFYTNRNGFEDRYKIDSISIPNMVDNFPRKLFTRDFKEKLKRGLYDIYENMIGGVEEDKRYEWIRIPNYFQTHAWYLYSKIMDDGAFDFFDRQDDISKGMFPELLQSIFDIFSDPYDSRLKGEKKGDRIEKMKRYFLLRLMNRDPEAPERYNNYIEKIKRSSDHGAIAWETEWDKRNVPGDRILSEMYDLDEGTVDNILRGEDTFIPTPFNIFVKNEHKPRRIKSSHKGGGRMYTKKKSRIV